MATLSTNFTASGNHYVQQSRTGNGAVYSVKTPSTALPLYEAVKIVGERYPFGINRGNLARTFNGLGAATRALPHLIRGF